MRTSYKFWQDKNYSITTAMMDKAIEAEYDILKNKAIAEAKLSGMTDSEAIIDVEGRLLEIREAAKESVAEYVLEIENIKKGGKSRFIVPSMVKIPSDALKEKKVIPDHIIELLGEENDPINRFINSAVAINNIKYKTQTILSLLEKFGTGTLLKTEEQVTKGDKESKQFRKVNDPLSPIDGMWISTEVLEIIESEDLYSSENAFQDAFLKMLRLGRVTKVLPNPGTWVKNIIGGWYTMAANGVVNTEFVLDFIDRGRHAFTGEYSKRTQDRIDKWAEYGLINSSVSAGLIGGYDAIYAGSLSGNHSLYNKGTERVKKVFSGTVKEAAYRYGSIDDHTKLIIAEAYEPITAMKLYGKKLSELTPSELKKVREDVAEQVKQTTPTFSRLPKIFYSLSKTGVIGGDFLGFKLASMWSSFGIIRNAVDDLRKSSEPGLSTAQRSAYVRSGMGRLIGLSTVVTGGYIVTQLLTELLLGDDGDDELVEDMKTLLPGYHQGNKVIFKSISKDLAATYYDYSGYDPYSDVVDYFMSGAGAIAGDPRELLKKINEDLGFNMAVKLGIELARNEDAYGNPIASQSDAFTQAVASYVWHISKFVTPPLISSSIDASIRNNRRLARANGVDYLSKMDAIEPTEVAGIMAQRVLGRSYEVDLVTSFKYYIESVNMGGVSIDKLEGNKQESRLAALNKIKDKYEAIVRIANKKGNDEAVIYAENILRKELKNNMHDTYYVLYGSKLWE